MSLVALPLPDRVESCPATATFFQDVVTGLRQPQKAIPCKYFYDARGSQLFDRICELDEYYPTRTEMAIMCRHIEEIESRIGPGCLLIEYGSGSSLKTRILLGHLREPAGYVPIDISYEHLMSAAEEISRIFPHLRVFPVCADYTAPDFSLPEFKWGENRRVVYFPGSTIGNFDREAALQFLRGIHSVCGEGGGSLIGVDLKKSRKVLEDAYNDGEGVTSAFNLNLLRRINRELGANFRLDQFDHRAFYNASEGRVEMHLVSNTDQDVQIGDERFHFRKGESIHTENSYKYDLDEFSKMAGQVGFEVEAVWTDEKNWFSVQFLKA